MVGSTGKLPSEHRDLHQPTNQAHVAIESSKHRLEACHCNLAISCGALRPLQPRVGQRSRAVWLDHVLRPSRTQSCPRNQHH